MVADHHHLVAGPGMTGVDDHVDTATGEAFEHRRNLVVGDHPRDRIVGAHGNVDGDQCLVIAIGLIAVPVELPPAHAR